MRLFDSITITIRGLKLVLADELHTFQLVNEKEARFNISNCQASNKYEVAK